VDEVRTSLLSINGKERPSNGDGPSDVTFGRRVGVGSGRGLEEKESKEDKDLGEDASLVVRSVHAERFKSSEENQDGCPSVIEGERKMDEEFVPKFLAFVIFLDDVVDMGDGAGNEECKDERNDVVSARPNVDIDAVQDREKRKPPADAIDDGLLASLSKLINDSAAEKEMNDGPDAKGIWSRCEVGDFAVAINPLWPGYNVDVGS